MRKLKKTLFTLFNKVYGMVFHCLGPLSPASMRWRGTMVPSPWRPSHRSCWCCWWRLEGTPGETRQLVQNKGEERWTKPPSYGCWNLLNHDHNISQWARKHLKNTCLEQFGGKKTCFDPLGLGFEAYLGCPSSGDVLISFRKARPRRGHTSARVDFCIVRSSGKVFIFR